MAGAQTAPPTAASEERVFLQCAGSLDRKTTCHTARRLLMASLKQA
jgi:heterodisulfide reductase subunit A-like polyferredoxin